VAGGALVVLTAQGVLAAQFAISGMPFTITATQLNAQGMEQYGGIDNVAAGSPNLADANGQQPVIVSAIQSATLTDLCQSVNLGFVNLVIHAGQGDKPVQATQLVTDSDTISGDASFTNLKVDIDASKMKDDPGAKGPLGTFGQEATNVVIDNLKQDNWATTASTFTLPGMSIGFSGNGC
jgi:hypothetical protein